MIIKHFKPLKIIYVCIVVYLYHLYIIMIFTNNFFH
jgi:hypothetical protein